MLAARARARCRSASVSTPGSGTTAACATADCHAVLQRTELLQLLPRLELRRREPNEASQCACAVRIQSDVPHGCPEVSRTPRVGGCDIPRERNRGTAEVECATLQIGDDLDYVGVDELGQRRDWRRESCNRCALIRGKRRRRLVDELRREERFVTLDVDHYDGIGPATCCSNRGDTIGARSERRVGEYCDPGARIARVTDHRRDALVIGRDQHLGRRTRTRPFNDTLDHRHARQYRATASRAAVSRRGAPG